MAAITEPKHAEGFLVSEAPNNRSRRNVTVLSGQVLQAGHVVARVLGSGIAQRYTGTGDGALTPDVTTPLLAGVQEGRYTAVCIEPGANVGTFAVYDPQGVFLGRHVVAAAAFANQIKFAIADGSTDFVAGDLFELFVGAGTVTEDGGNTGDGDVTLYQVLEGAQLGDYVLTCIAEAANGGTFSVVAPDGTSLGNLTVGTRYTQGGLDLLVADGSADWDLLDLITITVTRGTVKEYDPTDADGGGLAYGVLCAAVDATSAAQGGVVIVRDAIVNKSELEWFTSATEGQKITALAQLELAGVLAR
jgi:hypothetical protein